MTLMIRQIRFVSAGQRLARIIASEGGFADRDRLARDDNGRVKADVAAAKLPAAQKAVDDAPEDWRAWFQLSVALGDAGDPRAARAAVRRAIKVQRAHPDD